MSSQDSIQAQAANWLDRMNRSAFDCAEGQRFDAWMNADARHRAAFAEMAAIWDSEALAEACRSSNGAVAEIRPARAVAWRRVRAAGAAAICAALAAIVIVPAMPRGYATAPGEIRTVDLADGSSIELGGNSAMTVQMLPWSRNVTFSRGEALFDIAREEGRVFSVQIDATRVDVLGTAFFVDRLAADRSVVGVTRGRVRVNARGRALELSRGEAVQSFSGELTRTGMEPEQQMVSSGWFAAKNSPLSDLVEKLGRYSTREIRISSPEARGTRITGRFNISNVEETIDILRDIYGLDIFINGDEIIVSQYKCNIIKYI